MARRSGIVPRPHCLANSSFPISGPSEPADGTSWQGRRCYFSAETPSRAPARLRAYCGENCEGPCVDGSGLSRVRSRRSAGRSSHVFGLSVRLTGPLAIMPSADRVPVKSSHSTMLWPKWVVPITGSTGSALRAVGPFQPFHHTVCRRDLVARRFAYRASARGSL
jgi:hypothetical protein